MTPAPDTTPPTSDGYGATLIGGSLDTSEIHARIETFGRLFDALPSPPDAPALIYQVDGLNEVRPILLGSEDLIVGRSPESAGLAFPGNAKLSRAHFKIHQVEGFFVITDLDSKNGTFINSSNERITEHWANAGDLILAGDMIFAFMGD